MTPDARARELERRAAVDPDAAAALARHADRVSGLRREARASRGWDCIAGPCLRDDPPAAPDGDGRCTRGRDHGRHGDEWRYAVVSADRLVATSLVVYTSNMPAWTPAEMQGDAPPRGADLTTCVAFPFLRRHLAEPQPTRCALLASCRTFDTRALEAGKFFQKHGRASFEQPEAFWLALEAWHEEADARARRTKAEEVDGWHRCPTCDGTGFARGAP